MYRMNLRQHRYPPDPSARIHTPQIRSGKKYPNRFWEWPCWSPSLEECLPKPTPSPLTAETHVNSLPISYDLFFVCSYTRTTLEGELVGCPSWQGLAACFHTTQWARWLLQLSALVSQRSVVTERSISLSVNKAAEKEAEVGVSTLRSRHLGEVRGKGWKQ